MSPKPSPPAAAGAGKGIDAFPRKIAPIDVGGSDLAGTPKVVFQVHPELVAVPCRPWSRAVAVLVDGGEAGGEGVSSVDNRQCCCCWRPSRCSRRVRHLGVCEEEGRKNGRRE